MGNCLAAAWEANVPKRLCPSDGCRPAVLISEFGLNAIIRAVAEVKGLAKEDILNPQ